MLVMFSDSKYFPSKMGGWWKCEYTFHSQIPDFSLNLKKSFIYLYLKNNTMRSGSDKMVQAYCIFSLPRNPTVNLGHTKHIDQVSEDFKKKLAAEKKEQNLSYKLKCSASQSYPPV